MTHIKLLLGKSVARSLNTLHCQQWNEIYRRRKTQLNDLMREKKIMKIVIKLNEYKGTSWAGVIVSRYSSNIRSNSLFPFLIALAVINKNIKWLAKEMYNLDNWIEVNLDRAWFTRNYPKNKFLSSLVFFFYFPVFFFIEPKKKKK